MIGVGVLDELIVLCLIVECMFVPRLTRRTNQL